MVSLEQVEHQASQAHLEQAVYLDTVELVVSLEQADTQVFLASAVQVDSPEQVV